MKQMYDKPFTDLTISGTQRFNYIYEKLKGGGYGNNTRNSMGVKLHRV